MPMRLDSPFVLAFAGTLAIHTLMVVFADAVVVTNPYRPAPPAPRIDLVEVEVPKPPPPLPPPPAPEPEPQPEAATPPPPDPTPRPRRVARAATQPTPATAEPPPPDVPTVPTAGGSEVVRMDDIAPAARGVAVAPGRNTGRTGRGGSGGGTGAGSGTGAAEGEAPVSVATIKTRALPKGDYSYFSTGADYPAEARQLGIEGAIRVRLVVDASGKVTSATLLNKLGHGLDQLALARAKTIQFEPAQDTNDRPVTSVVVWTFHMTLPK